MRLNVKKRKELRISVSFTRSPLALDNLSSADTEIDVDVVDHFIFLGVTISSNLTWTSDVNDICAS